MIDSESTRFQADHDLGDNQSANELPQVVQFNEKLRDTKSEMHVTAGLCRHLQVLRLLGNTDQYESSGKMEEKDGMKPIKETWKKRTYLT